MAISSEVLEHIDAFKEVQLDVAARDGPALHAIDVKGRTRAYEIDLQRLPSSEFHLELPLVKANLLI